MTTLKYWTTTSSPTPAATQVGSLKSSTDPRNKTSSLEYDADGNLAKLTSPLGLKSTMVYDGSGRLTSQRDPRGNVPVPASGYLTASPMTRSITSRPRRMRAAPSQASTTTTTNSCGRRPSQIGAVSAG